MRTEEGKLFDWGYTLQLVFICSLHIMEVVRLTHFIKHTVWYGSMKSVWKWP